MSTVAAGTGLTKLQSRALDRGQLIVSFGSPPEQHNHSIEAKLHGLRWSLSRIWYIPRINVIEITGMFTDEKVRRLGLASWLFDRLLKNYPGTTRVTTASGTPKGRAWLLKQGFRKDAKSNDWILELHS